MGAFQSPFLQMFDGDYEALLIRKKQEAVLKVQF